MTYTLLLRLSAASVMAGCAPANPPPFSPPQVSNRAYARVAPLVREQAGRPVGEASVTLVRRAPPAPTLPRLVPGGRFFRLATGERFSVIEASDFALFARFMSGEDIEPVLRQRAGAGFNMLRVWTRMQLERFGIATLTLADHPDLYERVPGFLQLCARHGFYVELTAYTGREDYDPQHWNRLVEAVQGQTNVLLELVNENDQAGNHIDLVPFTRPAGVVASHGSNGSQAAPVQPFWDYADFHTNGAPEEQRKIGHNGWEIWNGPTITNETSRFPDVGMWRRLGHENESAWMDRVRRLAFDSAAGAALLSAGSAFHSVHGKSSERWDETELAVARAWAAGARSVPLPCQAGPYVHRQDLERPGVLRVYERPVPGHTCIVTIRQQ